MFVEDTRKQTGATRAADRLEAKREANKLIPNPPVKSRQVARQLARQYAKGTGQKNSKGMFVYTERPIA